MDNERYAFCMGEIRAMKSLLADTDYVSVKLVEDLIETMSTATALDFVAKYLFWLARAVRECGEVMRSRAKWRERINEMEAEIAAMESGAAAYET